MSDMFADKDHPKAPQIILNGKAYQRVPFQPENPDWLCIDCADPTAAGEIHELGCDAEECPRCGGQLLTCACLTGAKSRESAQQRDVRPADGEPRGRRPDPLADHPRLPGF